MSLKRYFFYQTLFLMFFYLLIYMLLIIADKLMVLHQHLQKNQQLDRRMMVKDCFLNVVLLPIQHQR